MLNVKEKASRISSHFSKGGAKVNTVPVSIAALYLDYSNRYGVCDKKLKEFASEIVKRYELPNKKENASWGELLGELELDERDYALITKELLANNNDIHDSFLSPSVSELVSLVLGINASDTVLDLGSGYGNFLVDVAVANFGESIRPTLLGQEINCEYYSVSCMALSMCGANYNIQNVNSISDAKCPSFTKGFIFPPFGLRYDGVAVDAFRHLGNDLFDAKVSYEWLFVLKAIEGMKPNGKIAVILPEGALFRTQDAAIRRYLLNNKLIEGVVSLPAGTFMPAMGIKTDLLVLSRGNESFKLVDGEEVLKDLPTRGVVSHEAAIDLYNAYFANDVEKIKDGDIKSLDCNLCLSALHAKDVYDGLKNLKKLSDVAVVFKGSPLTAAAFKDQLSNGKTPYQILSSGNIDDGIIDYTSLPFIADGKKYEKFALKKGDVVVTAKSTKVKFAVIADEPESTLIAIGGMIVVRPNHEFLDGTFLKMFFESSRGKQILESIKKGVVVTTIPFNDFLNVKVTCPSIEEQRKMAKKYNSLLAMYDGMKKEAESMEKRLASFYDENHEE